MKIALKIEYAKYLVFELASASQFLDAISQSRFCNSESIGGKVVYTPILNDAGTQDAMELSLLTDDCFSAPDEPLTKLTEANAEANQRWYREYTEHMVTRQKLAELEAKLSAIKDNVKTS